MKVDNLLKKNLFNVNQFNRKQLISEEITSKIKFVFCEQGMRGLVFPSFKDKNFASGDFCELLKRNNAKIKSFFSFKGELIFEKLLGGIINPPVLIRSKMDHSPLGVFKATFCPHEMGMRLNILEELRSHGFVHLPKIFKSDQNQTLCKIEKFFFYAIQFLPPDPFEISFNKFLKVTGKFHHYGQKILIKDELWHSKLKEYGTRGHYFIDPWFADFDAVFKDSLWKEIVKLSQYFLSQDFEEIFNKLTVQLIHGDNNQTNLLLSRECPYFIDFDSLRFDIRLLDLASYFRYGGFDRYIKLVRKNKFFKNLSHNYEKKCKKLTEIENKYFHLIVAFSHVEFISLCLKILKKAVLSNQQEKTKEYYEYILIYKEQMREIIEIIKSNYQLDCFDLKNY